MITLTRTGFPRLAALLRVLAVRAGDPRAGSREIWALVYPRVRAMATNVREDVGWKEDQALVRAMGDPNSGAAEEIYRRHAANLHRFIYRRIGEQAEDAEEI